MLGSKQCLAGALALAAAATTGVAQGAVVTAVGTTGVFDAAGTNDIDLDPTGQLAAFKTSVLNAYNADSGGSIDWSTNMPTLNSSSTSPNNTMTAIDVSYGISASNTLTITFDRTIGIYTNNINNQVSGLNDTNAIVVDGGNAATTLEYTMTFTGASVSQVGFAALARTVLDDNGATSVNYKATATYSDASTSSLSYALGAVLGDGVGSSDTFVHFAAGSGLTITSVKVEFVSENGGTALPFGKSRPTMDDLAFVIVPEPGSLALLGLGGLLVARRRRA